MVVVEVIILQISGTVNSGRTTGGLEA